MSMEFSYEEHYQTSVPLLKCDEQLIETLEDHQVDVLSYCKLFYKRTRACSKDQLSVRISDS